MNISLNQEQIAVLQNGGVAVMPTDTIYGVVGQALHEATVERIYQVKGRRPDKPFIILISSIEHVRQFGVELTEAIRQVLERYWPGPVSIILPTNNPELAYLHRGQQSLAFRLPEADWLLRVIDQTGPLVAPSANPEGLEPARTVDEGRAYFGDSVDVYIDGGWRHGKSSTLLRVLGDEVEILRP